MMLFGYVNIKYYICNIMSKVKYSINQEVIVNQETKKIIDFEMFDDLVLYYMDDGSAYPQNYVYETTFDYELISVIEDIREMSNDKIIKHINQLHEKTHKENKIFNKIKRILPKWIGFTS